MSEGNHYASKCILQHDMGSDFIMNSEVHPKDGSIIAVGIDHFNRLLKIQRHGNSKCMKSISFLFGEGKGVSMGKHFFNFPASRTTELTRLLANWHFIFS